MFRYDGVVKEKLEIEREDVHSGFRFESTHGRRYIPPRLDRRVGASGVVGTKVGGRGGELEVEQAPCTAELVHGRLGWLSSAWTIATAAGGVHL